MKFVLDLHLKIDESPLVVVSESDCIFSVGWLDCSSVLLVDFLAFPRLLEDEQIGWRLQIYDRRGLVFPPCFLLRRMENYF